MSPAPRTRLVLVHGTRVSSVQWTVHRRWLDPRFEVVCPDLPGHGVRALERFTMESAVAAVAEAVEGSTAPAASGAGAEAVDGSAPAPSALARPVGQPVVLVGHSLGGYVAMAYASVRSEQLAGLVLIGSTAVPRGVGAAAYRLLGWATERAGRERVTRLNDRLLSRFTPPEVFAAISEEGYWFDGVRDAWAAVFAGGRPELLRTVQCPVLIVRGQFDQVGIHAYRYAAQAPDARVVTVRGASHLLPLTRPQQTAALVADFAERTARQSSSRTDERADAQP